MADRVTLCARKRRKSELARGGSAFIADSRFEHISSIRQCLAV